MGAIERNGYVFEPEYSVISQDGAIHVYHNGEFIEEVKFSFNGKAPDLNEIQRLIDEYCHNNKI